MTWRLILCTEHKSRDGRGRSMCVTSIQTSQGLEQGNQGRCFKIQTRASKILKNMEMHLIIVKTKHKIRNVTFFYLSLSPNS